MKLFIISIGLMVISTTNNAQVPPACLKSIENKIVSFETSVGKLKELASTDTDQQFGNDFRRTESKEKALNKFLINCKNDNLEYDYTSVEDIREV